MGFDFEAAVQAPFRMQPGLRRLAKGAQQLTPNRPHSRHLQEKLAAFNSPAPPALQCMPGFDAAPALNVLAQQAAAEHPVALGWDGERAAAHHLGWAVQGAQVQAINDDALPQVGECLRCLSPAWRLPALLALAFAEDLAILDGRSAIVPWLAVALPSHWAPETKVGRHFAQVHAPVADNQLLLAAADGLARLVSAPTRWERFVWTITPNPRLNAHPDALPHWAWPQGDDDVQLAAAHWRTERQTFIPVPDAAQALFTIGVETQPLLQAIGNAAQARQLHDAVATMSPAVLRYRNLDGVRDALLRWLERRAAA
jgi:dimethylamine monooxygenase subunit A